MCTSSCDCTCAQCVEKCAVIDCEIEYTGDKCGTIEPYLVNTFSDCFDDLITENASNSNCRFFVYRAFLSGGQGTCLLKENKGNSNPNSDAISGRIKLPEFCP